MMSLHVICGPPQSKILATPMARGKVLYILSKKMMKINLTILFYFHYAMFHHYLSFPIVVLLKLLQYRPSDLRWATVIVVVPLHLPEKHFPEKHFP